MRKIIIICLCLLLNIAVWTQSRQAKIFYVNLYDVEVDVRLGEESDYVFQMEALSPYSSTYLLSSDFFGRHTLYFKLSSSDSWYFWADSNNSPIYCDVQSGKSHCILIGREGTVEFFTLTEDRGNGPKVCFLNGSNSEITRMEIGSDWNEGTEAFTRNLQEDTITNFVSIRPGDYSLFWQFPEQVRGENFFFYPDESGQYEEIFQFNNREYYLFLAYTSNGTDYAVLYDITP